MTKFKCKLFSHWSKFHGAGITINMINLEREANKLTLFISLSLTHTHKHTHTSGWNDNSFEGLLLLFFCSCQYILNFEQESRIHWENFVKMNILRREIRWHYKIKGALWFWMVKMCTPTSFHVNYAITHHTMWYSLVRWIRLLSHYNQTAPEFVFNRDHLFQRISDHICPNKPS